MRLGLSLVGALALLLGVLGGIASATETPPPWEPRLLNYPTAVGGRFERAANGIPASRVRVEVGVRLWADQRTPTDRYLRESLEVDRASAAEAGTAIEVAKRRLNGKASGWRSTSVTEVLLRDLFGYSIPPDLWQAARALFGSVPNGEIPELVPDPIRYRPASSRVFAREGVRWQAFTDLLIGIDGSGPQVVGGAAAVARLADRLPPDRLRVEEGWEGWVPEEARVLEAAPAPAWRITEEAYDALAQVGSRWENDDQGNLYALGWVNLYRFAVGLPPMVSDPALVQATRSHAQYLSRRKVVQHEQKPGDPDFVGVWPSDRIKAFGYTAGGGSEVAHGLDRPDSAVHSWISTVYHRLLPLSPTTLHAGFGRAPGAGVMNGGGATQPGGDVSIIRFPPPDGVSPELSFVGERPWPYPDTKEPSAAISLHVPGQEFDSEQVRVTLFDETTGEMLPTVLPDPRVFPLRDIYASAARPFVAGHWYRVRIQATSRQGRAVDEAWRFWASGQRLQSVAVSGDRNWARVLDKDGVPVVWRQFSWRWIDPGSGVSREGTSISRPNGDLRIDPPPPPGALLHLADARSPQVAAEILVSAEPAPPPPTPPQPESP